jgi:hypothetical protein
MPIDDFKTIELKIATQKKGYRAKSIDPQISERSMSLVDSGGQAFKRRQVKLIGNN